MGIEFKDFSDDIKRKLEEALNAGLYEAAGEIEGQAIQNTRVKTGQTKNSWAYYVDEGKFSAVIGNTIENSLWEEFGTGEYALHGDGRKGGWWYQDDKGDWHHTFGKAPNRAFQRAFSSKKNVAIQLIQNKVKDALK